MAKGTRRNGREYALKILYSLYDQDAPLDQVLSDFWGNFRFSNDVLGEPEEPQSPLSDDVIFFAEQLVKGVYEHLEEIDAMLLDTSKNWALDRMPRLDLSLMRMACYELIYVDKTPTNVVINEAIEIAKRYGTKDTPAFLNGVLDRIAKRSRS
ncbi:transcription antitermination factor NusB [uncultured Desulfuromonas sp.]|uniref:transcription antitermination factor NusB n=1 Tax=uncultured Desulfuromonas sp. TaxID=181013 RepID=UPI002AAB93C4|nr:transcription antitermination factor NusB [uncultured Desulfuromonas sp.]